MFKKIGIQLGFMALLVSFSSCNKWLDLQPEDGITGAEFWQTKEQVQAAVTGCYATLLGSPTGGRSLSESFFLWGELRADMLASTTATSSEEIDVMNVNILPTNKIADWRSVYQEINYCNTVIDFAPKVLSRDATFSQDALNKSIAEVKTLRALMYFYLVRTFGDVPLKLKSTSSDKDIEQLPKSTKEQVLDQIVKDLADAEPDAVYSFGNQEWDKGRVTKYTINAIQADVYLWMEKYTECVTACDKIINSNKFGLIDGTSPSAWFTTLYVNGNSNESIFELQFNNQRLNSFYPMFMQNRHFLANPAVLDEMYTIDYQDPENKDIRGDGASVRSSDQVIWKYIGWNNTSARSSSESYAHWIVYRYADILMMKAEAKNELGDGQAAVDIIYTIRNRAHALETSNQAANPADKIEIEDFILAERAREFAFEGKRWFDLLRMAKRNNYQRIALLLDLVARTAAPDRQQSAIAKIKDKNSHYLPIFYYELQTDKQLIQNPFYK